MKLETRASISRRQVLAGAAMAAPLLAATQPVRAASASARAASADERAIAALTATELHAQYTRRTLSPPDVLEAIFARIDRLDPFVGAFVALDRRGALEAARASAERWRRGRPLGSLDGVPVSFKQVLRVGGLPRSHSLATPTEPIALDPADETVVARVRAAGALVLGKTLAPSVGYTSSGVNEPIGTTRNPWDRRYSPGGSSAGAGAAAAAGFGPIHYGSDQGGSIRFPAAHCGVFGFKASPGVVPYRPESESQNGPLTRTVADTALAVAPFLAGAEAAAQPTTLRGRRVGYCPWFGDEALRQSPAVERVLESAIAKLRAEGVEVVDLGPLAPAGLWRALTHAICAPGAREELADLDPLTLASLHPQRRQWLLACAALDDAAAAAASKKMEEGIARLATALPFGEVPLLLTPTLPIELQFAHELWPAAVPVDPELQLGSAHLLQATLVSFLGLPAASLRCGTTPDGLPVGLQIAAARGRDLDVLSFAAAAEAPLGAASAGLALREA